MNQEAGELSRISTDGKEGADNDSDIFVYDFAVTQASDEKVNYRHICTKRVVIQATMTV